MWVILDSKERIRKSFWKSVWYSYPLHLYECLATQRRQKPWLQSLSHFLLLCFPFLSPTTTTARTPATTSLSEPKNPISWLFAAHLQHQQERPLHLLLRRERDIGSRANTPESQRQRNLGFQGGPQSRMSRKSWTVKTKPRLGPTPLPNPCLSVSRISNGSKPLRFVSLSFFIWLQDNNFFISLWI